jgi:hypothetical protein
LVIQLGENDREELREVLTMCHARNIPVYGFVGESQDATTYIDAENRIIYINVSTRETKGYTLAMMAALVAIMAHRGGGGGNFPLKKKWASCPTRTSMGAQSVAGCFSFALKSKHKYAKSYIYKKEGIAPLFST